MKNNIAWATPLVSALLIAEKESDRPASRPEGSYFAEVAGSPGTFNWLDNTTKPVLTEGAARRRRVWRHWRPRAETIEKEITIMNRFGLHMRPAAMFARMANQFHSKVVVAKDGVEVDGKSVMALISLAALKDAKLRVRVERTDARSDKQNRATDSIRFRGG